MRRNEEYIDRPKHRSEGQKPILRDVKGLAEEGEIISIEIWLKQTHPWTRDCRAEETDLWPTTEIETYVEVVPFTQNGKRHQHEKRGPTITLRLEGWRAHLCIMASKIPETDAKP